MKVTQPPHRRAFAALVPAMLLLAAPALAQEAAPATAPPAPTAVTPPPVVPTLPQASAQASGPRPLTNGVSARNGIGDPNSATPIAPEAIAQAEEARGARSAAPRSASTRPASTRPASTRPAARQTPPRAAPVRQATAPAPATAAPAPAATAPAAAVPVAAPAPAAPAAAPATTPVEAAAPAAATQTATTGATTSTTTVGGAPLWPWIVGGLVILAGLLVFFLRRRNRDADYEEVYEEPVYEEPVVQTAAEPAVIAPVAAPVVAEQRQAQGTRLEPQFLRTAPIAVAAAGGAAEQADAVAVDAELVEPEAEDVAALTAGTAHADRPWLEFAMRPVRAGGTDEDALVEIELTVGNSGAVAAQDVRISTFMFADGSASAGEMERLLTARAADSEVAPVTIEPGEGTRVDATLSLPRDHFGDDARGFNPVIVADARYRLADGSEGRTSASFTIGMIAEAEDAMPAIAIDDRRMTDDIEARLHGVPAHA